MFFPETHIRIWLYARPCDMRKSYDGLSALVNTQIKEDPLSGQLFAFVNKRKTHMKILYFDRSGYCIWSKRLEQGQFNYRASEENKRELNWTQLKLIMEGLELKSSRQFKRYSHEKQGVL